MDEERIAVFLDYENLAIGARDSLGGMQFDFGPIADALAERGRVILRRAYADWSMFDEDRRNLTRHHVELIEIPQRMGASRKNAADIKLVVDAIEQAYERAYVTTFVICTGDSDFTPLVYKLRELNKRVIGVGVRASTSKLLPPACDEFLFYENLEGVEPRIVEPPPAEEPTAEEEAPDGAESLETLIIRTLGGLQRSSGDNVLASSLKRALLRKDSTFSEADFGYRGFGELLTDLASRGVVELSEGPARGDPVVKIPEGSKAETEAFELLAEVVGDLARSGKPHLSGLKNEIRKRQSDFTEKKFGYSSFLQFCRAADRRGYIQLEFDPDAGDYVVRGMRFLDAEQTRECLPMPAAIDSQVAAFGEDVEIPLRHQLGVSLFMPGRVGDYAGLKAVSTVPGNPVGLVMVVGPDGSPLGVVDGPTLTAIRTGAGAGLATRVLAPPDAEVLAMLGAGAMAYDQVAAVRAVRPIERVLVWSRNRERAERLAERVGGEAVSDADAAVKDADIVSCATPAESPLFSPEAVRPGCHINAVGAFRPGMIEVPAEVTRQAFVVVDDREAAAAEAGDLIAAGREPDATLGEILAGREVPNGVTTLFKSVGIASQDIAAARAALEEAERRGIGTVVP